MRRISIAEKKNNYFFSAAFVLSASCIVPGPPARVVPDDRVMRQISQQERWAQQALDGRPTPDTLERIRGGDPASVGPGRKELKKLIQAIDRGTWVRDTAAELLREDGDPGLAVDFDRGGRLRADAIQAADALASALAEGGSLTVAELRPGFDALRKAQASEDALLKQPVRGMKLAQAPLPTPRPFLDAAAKVAAADAEAARQLQAQLPPEQATQLRARVADAERELEEKKRAQPPPPAVAPAPDGGMPPETEAQAPSNTLNVANDAAALIGKKAPKSITLREDGLFELSYDDGNYLVDPDGKLIRKEPPAK